jgi:hypothetical protein
LLLAVAVYSQGLIGGIQARTESTHALDRLWLSSNGASINVRLPQKAYCPLKLAA